MIRLKGIARTFIVGDEPVHALRGVDLHVKEGEYLSVMGASGSGKSTLLNIIGCLDKPTDGAYFLGDRNVAGLSENELSEVRRHRIGFVFQFFHLVPRLTAAANVELPMIFAGMNQDERRARVERALDRVGLRPRSAHRPAQLSGGERQRVAIARSIVMGPLILLADEPTGNLDTKTGTGIIELLETMNAEGLTMLVVTHDPKLGKRARRSIHITDGQIDLEENQ